MGSYWGLDLTSAQARPSALIALDGDLKVTFLARLHTDAEIVDTISSCGPAVVAIDAPLTLPSGWHCLEESHPCHVGRPRLRSCEAELARSGVSCFFTTKRSFIKGMVYRAIALKKRLEGRGLGVIEVYPYAIKVYLWGKPIPKKTKAEGCRFLREHVVAILPSLAPYSDCLNHDLGDAALAAYTAFLYSRGKTRASGDESGAIHLPAGSLDTPGYQR